MASNFCCGETEPRKLHTPLTPVVLWLGFNLAETALARSPARRRPSTAGAQFGKSPTVDIELKQREERERQRRRGREWDERARVRDPRPFGSSFYVFFLLPLGLPFVNWASHECCFFYLRSSLRSSDLPLFYFCGFSPSLSFSHHHSVLDSFFLF